MTTHKTLREAVLAVMKDVPYVQKTGKMQGGGSYSFASETDVINALHESMTEHGVIGPIPVNVAPVQISEYKTAKSTMNWVIVCRTFKFMHAHSDDEQEVMVMGEASDVGDKAVAKAHTMAKKYALREFFLLETGNDPDEVWSEREAGNYAFLERAHQRIQAAKTEKEINECMTQFKAAKEKARWSEAQWGKLETLAAKRTKAVRGR